MLADPFVGNFEQPIGPLEKGKGCAGSDQDRRHVEGHLADGQVLRSVGFVDESQILPQILRCVGGPAALDEGHMKVGYHPFAVGLLDEGHPIVRPTASAMPAGLVPWPNSR
jgi:hypothetical protein